MRLQEHLDGPRILNVNLDASQILNMDYQIWQAMPDSLEKWAIAAVIFWSGGDNGLWPVNIPSEEIRQGLLHNVDLP